jgi:photosystem II stability/assembly factor-like uncharacterized protein
VGSSGCILRTSDAGQTWTLEENMTNRTLVGVAMTDACSVTAVGGDGVILSTMVEGTTRVQHESAPRRSFALPWIPRELPSGACICVLRIDGFVESRTMLRLGE